MVRNLKLEKYIKRHTGKTVKVHTVKRIKGGYGAIMNPVNGLRIKESNVNYKPLIWHEMGHLMAQDYYWVENEVKAQEWALKILKQLGIIRYIKNQ